MMYSPLQEVLLVLLLELTTMQLWLSCSWAALSVPEESQVRECITLELCSYIKVELEGQSWREETVISSRRPRGM